MNRLQRLVKAIQPSRLERDGAALVSTSESVAALLRQVTDISECVRTMTARVADTRRRVDEMVATQRSALDEQVRLGGIPRAKLLSGSLVLDGTPGARMRVRRVSVGEPFEAPFSTWMGVTRCASTAPDVRAMWEHLLAGEAVAGDGILRGSSSTILDVPGAVVSRTGDSVLHVSLRRTDARRDPAPDVQTPEDPIVAVPKCTYDFPSRKIRNFGHWLLDCVPHVVALSTVAPGAVFLLPNPLKAFQRSTLSLAGLSERQMIPWDGTPRTCGRLLILESDGRAGGGRPLSALTQLRRLVAAGPSTPHERRHRRIYVSRRDAKAKRRWASNEPDVEALFQSRGFEVLCMADCPLPEQVRLFREAGIVAGISGAGLTDVLFASPGTHVIALLSDSLIRWYADESGARSLWSSSNPAPGGQLAAFGDSPRFYAHLAAAFGQFCHSFVGGDEMPLEALSVFLDDVLRQADHL